MTKRKVDEYTLNECIGKGSFGEVYYTTKEDSSIPYATKRFNRENVEKKENISYFINEITILKEIYHKNIIKIESLKKTKNHYYVIMEYCNGGTLTENVDNYKLKHGKPLPEKSIQHIMRQLVDAVTHLHSKGILHRDLKPENILLNYNTEEAKNNIDILNSELKLIDFGTSTHKSNNTVIGSPYTMDPLILKMFISGQKSALPYDEKIDIWSLGIIFFYLLTGNLPFMGNFFDVMNQIENGDINIPLNISAEAISFLLKMIQYFSEKRFSAADLLNHPFIKNYIGDFSYLDQKQISNFIKNGSIVINIKNNDPINSFINQYINKKKSTINSNSNNNSLDTKDTKSIDNSSFYHSAPLFKPEGKQQPPQYTSNYNSAIFNPQNFKQIDDLMDELKTKEREYNNQNVYNSSPIFILPKNMESFKSVYPSPNNKIEMPQNQYNSQVVPDFSLYENKKQTSSNNIPKQKITNNYQYKIGQYNNQNPNQGKQAVSYEKNNNTTTPTKNQRESSTNINYLNQQIFQPGKYNSVQPDYTNNNSYHPNYGYYNLNNQVISTNIINSSSPIQGLKNFTNNQ